MVRIPLLFCKENGRTNRRLPGNKLLATMGYWTLVCEFVYVAVVVHCHRRRRRRRCRCEFGFVFLLFYYSIVTAGIVFCAVRVSARRWLWSRRGWFQSPPDHRNLRWRKYILQFINIREEYIPTPEILDTETVLKWINMNDLLVSFSYYGNDEINYDRNVVI